MEKKIDEGKWIVEAQDTKDGSGDVIVPIPEEIMNALGLAEDSPLDIHVLDDGSITLTPQRHKQGS